MASKILTCASCGESTAVCVDQGSGDVYCARAQGWHKATAKRKQGRNWYCWKHKLELELVAGMSEKDFSFCTCQHKPLSSGLWTGAAAVHVANSKTRPPPPPLPPPPVSNRPTMPHVPRPLSQCQPPLHSTTFEALLEELERPRQAIEAVMKRGLRIGMFGSVCAGLNDDESDLDVIGVYKNFDNTGKDNALLRTGLLHTGFGILLTHLVEMQACSNVKPVY